MIATQALSIGGLKALTEYVGVIMSRFDVSGNDYEFTVWCRFVNQVEKVEGNWKLLTLEVIYQRDLIVPVPDSPPLDFSNVKDWPRKSYRFTSWHLRRRGLEVRDDPPGEDDEKSVDDVMDRNWAWIDAV